ncbi:MAG: acyl-CoA dehydrogenase [Candidatus Binataceae bacterium]
MDLSYSAAEEAFREKVRSFLAANLPPGWGTKSYVQPARDAQTEFLREWQRKLYDAGLLGLEWPKEYGGQGASLIEKAIFNEEMAKFRAPYPLNIIGLINAGNTIIVHGTQEQKKRYLPKILSCEEIWCQGFSEPGAGSDLASLRTRALLRGDEFIVNGQKVWTSDGHIAQMCLLLVRTDPTAPKHRGISCLLVDMKTPGVTVKPLRQMTGETEFNEVFFEDVVVPRENLLGEMNQGWRVAVTTMTHERGTMTLALARGFENSFNDLIELCRRMGPAVTNDPLRRQRLAQFYIELQSLKYTAYRDFSKILCGAAPGPEGSISKINWEINQRLTEFALELEGPASQLVEGSPRAVDMGAWQYGYMRARANSIEGGTSEIQRNTLAERMLGLPRSR